MCKLIRVTLGIDDFHPESSHEGFDCGGDMDKGAYRLLDDLFEAEPELRATLYVTPNWTYRPKDEWKGDPYDIRKHPKWLNWLSQKQSKGRVELAEHGYTHSQPEWPYGNEFGKTSKEGTLDRFCLARDCFLSAALPVSRGFRPPCWAVSNGFVDALACYDFAYVAASSDVVSKIHPQCVSMQWGLKGVPLIQTSKIPGTGVVNIPVNWDPYWSDYDRAASIAEFGGIISITSHIQRTYWGVSVENGLSPRVVTSIIDLFERLRSNSGTKLQFYTHGDLCLQHQLLEASGFSTEHVRLI